MFAKCKFKLNSFKQIRRFVICSGQPPFIGLLRIIPKPHELVKVQRQDFVIKIQLKDYLEFLSIVESAMSSRTCPDSFVTNAKKSRNIDVITETRTENI